MAYIDAENTLMTVSAADLGTAMTGPIVDLGSKGGFLSPLYIDAKLTKKMTSLHRTCHNLHLTYQFKLKN